MIKKIIYIDLDDTICDYTKQKQLDLLLDINISYPQSVKGFFSSLEPIDYAIPCIDQLEESGVYEVWFATAPSFKNIHCYSEKAEWIVENLGEEWLERLIIIPDKSKLKGDYLVDDYTEGRAKQNLFEGELIHFGSEKFQSWIDVTTYLLNT